MMVAVGMAVAAAPAGVVVRMIVPAIMTVVMILLVAVRRGRMGVRHAPMSHPRARGSTGARPTSVSARRVAADSRADQSSTRAAICASSASAET